ncbi:MAG: SDR family NAD(P)-dependent oxidoreductase [Vulcanimicrobiaceae bacterium]|jgi:NAD(P)-dependent dehydrogenase (short-subunit alcohol dehydrogenase family)
MNLRLDGKTALVTGSTAGIGYAIAEGLAAQGARVIVNGRTQARVDDAIRNIKATQSNAQLVGAVADLGTAAGADLLVKAHPNVDVLVNNVGVFAPKPFEEIPDADWLRFFEVNVMLGVRLARAYLPQMRKANWGRIIFISSESGVQIPVEMIHYGVTKTAQIALARGIAESVAGTGITVNSVLPGPTKSEGIETFVAELAKNAGISEADFEKQFFATMRPTSLLKRFATPEEVANMVVYVCSPAASATNGAALRVDGGVIRAIL